MLTITKENWQNILLQIYQRSGMVEVKGESLEHLFFVRLALKEIIDSIVEIPENKSET